MCTSLISSSALSRRLFVATSITVLSSHDFFVMGGVILSLALSAFDLAVVICMGEPLIDHSFVPPSRRISMKLASSNVGLFLDSSFVKSLLKFSLIPYALSNIRKNLQKKILPIGDNTRKTN